MKTNKIKTLIDFDSPEYKPTEILDDNIFEIDRTSLRDFGNPHCAANLTEYDAIILNYFTPQTFQSARFDQLKNFLSKDDKTLIMFLNSSIGDHHNSNLLILRYIFAIGQENLDDVIKINNHGTQYSLKPDGRKSFLYKYLNSDKKNWKISLKEHESDFITQLAINTDDETIAFVLKNESITATNVFIPWISESENLFWELISEYLLSIKTDFKDVEEWVKSYSFPNLTNVEKEIINKEEAILLLEKQKDQLEEQKQRFEKIRNTLLYHDGNLLCEVCKDVLLELGINALDGEPGREDLFFIEGNEHYLIEVKGCEKSANKGHIKQIISHKAEYTKDKEVGVKGILLINAWRKFSLEERVAPDKVIFPNEIMKLVGLGDIVLLTSQQLFVAYCEHLEGKFELKPFIKKLNKTQGVFEGFNNVGSYKKDTC